MCGGNAAAPPIAAGCSRVPANAFGNRFSDGWRWQLQRHAPDRDDYPKGSEGAAQFALDVERFIDCNFDGKGVELRTLDQHELKSGFFGAWYERNGHGRRTFPKT